jgi:hypothetical protein
MGVGGVTVTTTLHQAGRRASPPMMSVGNAEDGALGA